MASFEKYLSIWVALAIGAGVGLGLLFPGAFEALAQLEIARVNLVIALLSAFAAASAYALSARSSRLYEQISSSVLRMH